MFQRCENPTVSAARRNTDILLAELSHRMGNEITAALAALRVVQRAIGETDATCVLDQAVLRLEQFGEIHHLLDPSREHGKLARRLEGLCRAISVAKAAPRGIHIALSADDVAVDDKIAWTACVVVSELLTNVLKHAFGDGATGLVIVELREMQDTVCVSVADNGCGTPSATILPGGGVRSAGAGWKIIMDLIERVGGTIDRRGQPSGTTVTVDLPIRLPARCHGERR